jgi:hypothetical protein
VFDDHPLGGEYHPQCQRGLDNQPCLQAAIDRAAGHGGGVVAIPPGTWTVSGSLTLRSNVTLRGVTLTGSALLATDRQPLVVAEDGGEGWSVENLTLDGGADETCTTGAESAISVAGGASFAILRRLLVRRLREDAIAFRGGALGNVFVESVAFDRCGRSALVLAPEQASSAIFLTDISIHGFGRAAAAAPAANAPCAAVHLQARCAISQIHIEPVGSGQTGIWFDRNSDYTMVNGLYVGLAGGTPTLIEPARKGIALSTEAFRDLTAS